LNSLAMAAALLGGLALFLFGLERLTEGLKSAAGDRLKDVLAKLTTTRLRAVLAGAAVTAVIQSSSVTTVLVVGFVSAGMMTLAQSIGIIIGANVGSTLTAQVVAFNVTAAALPMFAAGFTLRFAGRGDGSRQLGTMLMGLGLLFHGMAVMGDAMEPLRSYPPFLDLMTHIGNPLPGMLVAMLFTALVQSSAATTGIVIVMASQGFITLEAGIALAIGANVGTCVTAVLATLGKSREAVRAATVHVLFNVIGASIWLPLIPLLAGWVTAISPSSPELEGAARLAAEVPRQIANAHTMFNVINTLLFIGFTGPLARLVTRMVPDRPGVAAAVVRPRFLDESLLETPALALQRVRFELGHLGEIVRGMLMRTPAALGHDAATARRAIAEIVRDDDRVDLLQAYVLGYLGKIRQRQLTETESRDFQGLMNVTDYLEHAGDVLETELAELARHKLERGLATSPAMNEVLTKMFGTVVQAFDDALSAVREEDAEAARRAIELKPEIDRRMKAALAHQAAKLVEGDAHRLELFRTEMDLLDAFKRIYTLSKRIARTVPRPAEGEKKAERAATA
jgi:phosphate:Na+ symporter